MSEVKKLIARLGQAKRAELYNNFLMKYLAADAAREVLEIQERIANFELPIDAADPLLEKILAAVNLDEIRKAAERGGRARTPRKTRAARENGRKGGRPRKTRPGARISQTEGQL